MSKWTSTTAPMTVLMEPVVTLEGVAKVRWLTTVSGKRSCEKRHGREVRNVADDRKVTTAMETTLDDWSVAIEEKTHPAGAGKRGG